MIERGHVANTHRLPGGSPDPLIAPGGSDHSATTTQAGLKVRCQLDENIYPAGIKVSHAEMDAVNLTRHDFHGEWNYTVSPKVLVLKR